MSKNKEIIYCPNCLSTNVYGTADVEWDMEKQEFIITEVYSGGCLDCEGSFIEQCTVERYNELKAELDENNLITTECLLSGEKITCGEEVWHVKPFNGYVKKDIPAIEIVLVQLLLDNPKFRAEVSNYFSVYQVVTLDLISKYLTKLDTSALHESLKCGIIEDVAFGIDED